MISSSHLSTDYTRMSMTKWREGINKPTFTEKPNPSFCFPFLTVYPTGATIRKPDKCWNGSTLFPSDKGVDLIDMDERGKQSS